MANLDITQRNSLERSTLAGNDGLRRGTETGSAIYTAFALALGGVLAYGSFQTFAGGWEWVVLGMIVVTTIGAMIALSPNRRG